MWQRVLDTVNAIGESVDTFVQDLYRLADNNGTLKDDLIQGLAMLYGNGKPASGDERTPTSVLMKRHHMAIDRPPAESL